MILFYPPPTDHFEKCLLIAFSNSGETKEVIDQLRLYRGVQSRIISITNESNSTIAKKRTLKNNNSFLILSKKSFYQVLDISSQIPVVYIIERICRKLQAIKNIDIDG